METVTIFYAKRCRPVVRTGARRTTRSLIRISKRMIGKNSKKQTDAIAASAIRRTQHYSEKNTTAENYVIRPSAGPRYRGTSACPADIEYHKKKYIGLSGPTDDMTGIREMINIIVTRTDHPFSSGHRKNIGGRIRMHAI